MDLDISAPDVARILGRAPKALQHSMVRELGPEDLARLQVEQGTKAPSVLRLNDRHHALARALASGQSPGQAAIFTGYSASRISILQDDPAFKELLTFYRSESDAATAQALARVTTMTLTAIALLEDRMENAPDDMRTRELLDVATAGLDRTGHGPSSKVQVTNLTLTAAEMAALAQAAQETNVRVIEGRATPGLPDRNSDVPSLESLADGETSREPGEGDLIREDGGPLASRVGEDAAWCDPALGPMAEVSGLQRSGSCSTRSLPGVPEPGPPD